MVNKWHRFWAGALANIPLLSGYSWNTLPWIHDDDLSLILVGGFACYFKAMEETSAQETSSLFLKKPVLAPVFAFLFWEKVISWNMGLGILSS